MTLKKQAFGAEIAKLLHIITHSLYTNREIFLRELVSNASDAVEKRRILAQQGQAEAGEDATIDITVDKDGKRLVVADSGVGMTEAELIDNLGVVARSGSEDFAKKLAETEAAHDAKNLIGRFGVGFYSVFMAASSVTVKTRSAAPGSPSLAWISDGQGEFAVEPLAEEVPIGTRIEATIREDAAEFLDPDHIRRILKRHSNFVAVPLFVDSERVNTVPALWREPKFQITKEQYREFYEFLTHDADEPLSTLHIAVDAPVQFAGIVFAPSTGRDLFGLGRDEWGLDLYSRRVLISREVKDVLPEYLSFLKGVIDAEDLPLNISRETLQENALIRKIRQVLVKHVLDHLTKLAKDEPEAYEKIWKEHGRILKYGYSDYAERDRVAGLLRFQSSALEAGALTSLDAYIERKPFAQKSVYYQSGPSREAILVSPHSEAFRAKGIELLHLTDPVDEAALAALGRYKDTPLVNVEEANLDEIADLPDKEGAKKSEELTGEAKEAFTSFLDRVRAVLGERVKEVRAAKGLVDSPARLVGEGGVSAHMEKLLKAMNKDMPRSPKIFELNGEHPLVKNLALVHKTRPEDGFVSRVIEQLYESAMLSDGWLEDPHKMVERVTGLLRDSAAWYLEREKLS